MTELSTTPPSTVELSSTPSTVELSSTPSTVELSATSIFTTDILIGWGTVALAVGTFALAAAAWVQIPIVVRQLKALSDQIRESRKMAEESDLRLRQLETLKICSQSESDPTIVDVSRRIWEASDEGKNYTNTAVKQHDLIIMLNYLDSVAVGIEQGLYIESIAKAHLGLMFRKVVEVIFPSKAIDTVGYEAIIKTYDEWYPKAPEEIENSGDE
ncbi:MAG: hypothetical protein KF899_09470 [Parvibaculum sp.]|nr:hypothetical protein [Parvibaculum sp.]